MKKVPLSFLLLLLPFIVFPQQIVKDTVRKTHLFLDVSIGASIPVGNYTSEKDATISTSKSGFATTGMILNAALFFLGKSDFSLGIRYTYQNNPFRESAKKLVLPNSKDSLGSGGWKNHYLMPGIFFMHQENRLSYDAQILAGLILSNSPVFQYMDPLSALQKSAVAYGWAFGLNVGFGYNISPKVTLKVNAGYLTGFPTFSKDIPSQFLEFDTVTQMNIYSAPRKINIKKVVSAFNVGAGLLIKL